MLAGKDALCVGLDKGPEAGLEAFWEAAGRLAAAGVPITPAALWEGTRPEIWPVPKKKGLNLKISGTNPGRPYPPGPDTPKLPPPRPPQARMTAPATCCC